MKVYVLCDEDTSFRYHSAYSTEAAAEEAKPKAQADCKCEIEIVTMEIVDNDNL